MLDLVGRGERIRTSDLTVPNRALYQAEPRPEMLADNREAHQSCQTRPDPYPNRPPSKLLQYTFASSPQPSAVHPGFAHRPRKCRPMLVQHLGILRENDCVYHTTNIQLVIQQQSVSARFVARVSCLLIIIRQLKDRAHVNNKCVCVVVSIPLIKARWRLLKFVPLAH